MNKKTEIVRLLHYIENIGNGYEYAIVSEKNNKSIHKFYSKENLPKKYKSIICKKYDMKIGNIEKWYL